MEWFVAKIFGYLGMKTPQFNLGVHYMGMNNYNEALYWFKKAYSNNHDMAAVMIAGIYKEALNDIEQYNFWKLEAEKNISQRMTKIDK